MFPCMRRSHRILYMCVYTPIHKRPGAAVPKLVEFTAYGDDFVKKRHFSSYSYNFCQLYIFMANQAGAENFRFNVCDFNYST